MSRGSKLGVFDVQEGIISQLIESLVKNCASPFYYLLINWHVFIIWILLQSCKWVVGFRLRLGIDKLTTLIPSDDFLPLMCSLNDKICLNVNRVINSLLLLTWCSLFYFCVTSASILVVYDDRVDAASHQDVEHDPAFEDSFVVKKYGSVNCFLVFFYLVDYIANAENYS